MGLAMHNYHSAYRHLPSGLRVDNGILWSGAILPQLELSAIFNELDLDQPLNLGNNADILRLQVETFLCPSASVSETFDHGVSQRATVTYIGCASGTVSRETAPDNLLYQLQQDGMLYRDSCVRLSHVTDGTAHTILIGETLVSDVAGRIDGSGLPQFVDHWGIASPTLANNEVSEALGSTRVKINIAVDAEGPHFPDERELSFSSHHPAGVHFVFSDGHVEMFSHQIDAKLYSALGTRRSKEIIPPRN